MRAKRNGTVMPLTAARASISTVLGAVSGAAGCLRSGDNGRWVAVVQRVDHFPRRYPVDGRVVQFEQHAERPGRDAFDVVDAFDDPQLPRRAGQVNRSGVQVGWCRSSTGASRVVASGRCVGREIRGRSLGRRSNTAAARSNGTRASLLRKPADKCSRLRTCSRTSLNRRAPPGSVGLVVDSESTDMEMLIGSLGVEERCVESRKLFHHGVPSLGRFEVDV